jgi:hypothetical protein
MEIGIEIVGALDEGLQKADNRVIYMEGWRGDTWEA